MNTGTAPLAPNRRRLVVLGEIIVNIELPPMSPRDPMSVITYMITDKPITNGMNPMSLPSSRTAVAYPHNPGLRRPQL